MLSGADLAAGALRAAGLSVTRPRVAVLDWLAAHPHASAAEILAGVRAGGRRVSHQTVYDVLRSCAGHGLVGVLDLPGHPARFERRTGDDHHHLVCRACGRIDDVEDVAGEAPCATPAGAGSFDVDTAEVTFWGTCPDCAPADITDHR